MLFILLLLQDKNEPYFLLNNLLNLNSELENDALPCDNSHRREQARQEIFNMDWLDSLEFKEEQAETEDFGFPEKDSERKRKHNQGERLFLPDIYLSSSSNVKA
jgi:hypothetical protein